MASPIQEILKSLDDYEKDPASAGVGLRLDLSTIIHRHLKAKGWTQAKLAAACGMKSPLLTRIMHGASNCTFETAGRILFALGIRGQLIAAAGEPNEDMAVVETEECHGKEIIKNSFTVEPPARYIGSAQATDYQGRGGQSVKGANSANVACLAAKG